jgi:hypothetical protein
MLADAIVWAAVERASGGVIYAEPKRPEAQLVRALYRELAADERVGTPRTECGFVLSGWTRPPGGVDLSAGFTDGGSCVIEAKVGKPEEAIWDIIKLADILALDVTITAAYLIYDATSKTWAKTDRATSLFTEPEQLHTVRELIESSRPDWEWLLKGGRGIRPITCVAAIRIAHIGSRRLSAHEGHELRVLRVVPDVSSSLQRFDTEGWPTD